MTYEKSSSVAVLIKVSLNSQNKVISNICCLETPKISEQTIDLG